MIENNQSFEDFEERVLELLYWAEAGIEESASTVQNQHYREILNKIRKTAHECVSKNTELKARQRG